MPLHVYIIWEITYRSFIACNFVTDSVTAQTNATAELDFRPSAEFPALQYLDSVDPGSRSDRAGLKSGDFILEVGVTVSRFGPL